MAIQKAFIKERGAEVFRKIRCFSSSKSSLKISRHLVQLLAIRILIANGAHCSVCGPFIYYIQLLATALEPVANGAENFFQSECFFSVGIVAVNTLR
jgi:hypothetical protein